MAVAGIPPAAGGGDTGMIRESAGVFTPAGAGERGVEMLDNAEKLRRIKWWQESGQMHPATCGNEDCRADLIGIEKDGDVILRCPECGYEQPVVDIMIEYPPELLNPARPE